MKKPESVEILGIPYTITYCSKPSDVDHNERRSLWGQIDYWKRSIRIYDNTSLANVWDSLIHEILHGLICDLRITGRVDYNDQNSTENEHVIGMLALGLRDVLFRNKWLNIDDADVPGVEP